MKETMQKFTLIFTVLTLTISAHASGLDFPEPSHVSLPVSPAQDFVRYLQDTPEEGWMTTGQQALDLACVCLCVGRECTSPGVACCLGLAGASLVPAAYLYRERARVQNLCTVDPEEIAAIARATVLCRRDKIVLQGVAQCLGVPKQVVSACPAFFGPKVQKVE
jgi:hypothetical protein